MLTIDSPKDHPDQTPGDGLCESSESTDRVCTLRAAIQESNAAWGEYTFTFAIGEGGPVDIEAGILPGLTSVVHIDGTTQPGYAGAPLVQLRGAFAGTGLWVRGDGSSVAGLAVTEYETGILLDGSAMRVADSYIGLDNTGAATDGNYYGIRVVKGTGNQVGYEAHRNVISGNYSAGVLVHDFAARTRIQSNWFGLRPDGTTPLFSRSNAIRVVDAPDTMIGGDQGHSNVISGSGLSDDYADAMWVQESPRATISNNVVGLDAIGQDLAGNFGTGISLLASPGSAVTSNVVSGNKNDGIAVTGDFEESVQIRDNLIGPNADESVLIGNGRDGIILGSSADVPGGAGGHVVIESNVINGVRNGILLADGASDNTVTDNMIGGVEHLEGVIREAGIYVWGGTSNVIGGPERDGAHTGNVIGSARDGIIVYDAEATMIQSNALGEPSFSRYAIGVGGGATGTVVGYRRDEDPLGPGGCPALCNRISVGTGDGVSVQGDETAGTTVRGNEIVSPDESPQHGLAIGLGTDSKQTPNDGPRDEDTGANGLLNFPIGVVPTYVGAHNQTYVHGSLAVAPGAEPLLVDVYRSEKASASGYGRGEEWVGSLTVAPKESADNGTHFEFKLPDMGELTHYFYSATVTDANGSTSEMSATCRDTDGDGFGDGDGDGLCDDWETKNSGSTGWGLDYDGDGRVEYALGDAPYRATPDRRDLFVEVDAMAAGHGFPAARTTPAAMAHMAKAFAAGPGGGIRVHVNPDADTASSTFHDVATSQATTTVRPRQDRDNDIFDAKNGEDTLDKPCDGSFGTFQERRQGATCATSLAARRLIFRYVLWTHQLDGQDPRNPAPPAGLAPGAPSADAAVAMLSRREAIDGGGGLSVCRSVARCRDVADSWTLMHELGHTLGLEHGGDEPTNQKINYLSIMNYRYAYPNGSHSQGFSRWTLPKLDLGSLDERTGILDGHHAGEYPGLADWGSATYTAKVREDPEDPGSLACFGTYFSVPGEPIDWNGDWDVEDSGIEANPGPRGKDGPIDWCLTPAADRKSTSFNDWAALRFGTRNVDPLSESATYPLDADRTSDLPGLMAETADQDGDGVSDARDVCRTTPDPGQDDEDGDEIGDACVGEITERDLSVEIAVEEREDASEPARVSVVLRNDFPLPATGLRVAVRMPEGLQPRSVESGEGSFDATSSTWSVPRVEKRASAELSFSVSSDVEVPIIAELVVAGQVDPDSTPGNGVEGAAGLEDDWASAVAPSSDSPAGPTYVVEMSPHNAARNDAGDLAWSEPVIGGGRRVVTSIGGGPEQEVMAIPAGDRLQPSVYEGGQVVVRRIYGDGQSKPADHYLWQEGELTQLPPDFDPSEGNTDGLLVGAAMIEPEVGDPWWQAATWQDGDLEVLPGPRPEVLDSLEGSSAEAINDAGLIVGSVHGTDPRDATRTVTFAAMWRDGELVRTVDRQRAGATASGFGDVNEAGVAVGVEGQEHDEAPYPLLATTRTASLLGFEGSATAINDAGDVLGRQRGTGADFVRHDGHTYLVEDLLVGDGPLRPEDPVAVEDDGTIYGFDVIDLEMPAYGLRAMVARPASVGRRAMLSPLQDYLETGTRQVGTISNPLEVRVYNLGSAPIAPAAPQVSGPASGDVRAGWGNGPVLIEPGAYRPLQVWFVPSANGLRSAWIELDGPGTQGDARILVEGTGSGGPTEEPTEEPTEDPTSSPTAEPTSGPTPDPTSGPTTDPTTPPTQPVELRFVQVRKPRITGTARVGRRLFAHAGTWTPEPSSVRYRWYRNGKPIPKAIAKTYRPRPTDRGRRIRVVVTVARIGYTTATSTSTPTRIRR